MHVCSSGIAIIKSAKADATALRHRSQQTFERYYISAVNEAVKEGHVQQIILDYGKWKVLQISSS